MLAHNLGLNTMLINITILLILVGCIESQEALENPQCNHYPDRGTCEDRGFVTKWYYDRYAHRCREFYYGGCEGNENRFDSLQVCISLDSWNISECSQACKFESSDDPRIRCVLPHDPGTCAGNFERWHFDIQIRQCVCSWWSGCGGNANMFYSYAHCMSICGIFANSSTSETKLAIRRYIKEPQNTQVFHVIYQSRIAERQQYRNLFASSTRNSYQRPQMQYGRSSVRRQPSYAQKQTTQQYYQHAEQYGSPQQWQRSPSQVSQQHVYQATSYQPERDLRLQSQQPGTYVNLNTMPSNHVQGYAQMNRQASYGRPQEALHARQYDQVQYGLQTPQSRDSFIRQQRADQHAHEEALRERERLLYQRRREEYDRAIKYQQDLYRYQQAIYAAQNGVPVEHTRKQAEQRQTSRQTERDSYRNLEYAQVSTTAETINNRRPDEIKREKLRRRKLKNFEKLKQLEKMRKLMRTTSRPVTTVPRPPTQPISTVLKQPVQSQKWTQQNMNSRGHISLDARSKQIQALQQHSLHHRTSSVNPQQQINHFNGTTTTAPSEQVNKFNNQSAIKSPNLEQQHKKLKSEHLPAGMVLSADQVPDHFGVHHAETVSANPLSAKSADQQKHVITIEDYEENDHYPDDQQFEEGNSGMITTETTKLKIMPNANGNRHNKNQQQEKIEDEYEDSEEVVFWQGDNPRSVRGIEHLYYAGDDDPNYNI
ncbi:unnamed protein product [Thelazia callipaeda]|uniref:BPTI/Kunitz inhibitor domain-containing protein n=1 Tax=Thelazia callipaeda TaxID=103827 RepID=A0A0N5D9V8_THECL|nr:unnamed protein product [Thelazia callipaeda]